MTTPEEIKAEYASSLADLTFNSKPLINVLTMLAEENSPNAKVIVEAIETHLTKVSTDVKLPVLYLIDCIVKNVGGTYTSLFSQNIVSTFCGVFKAVDEKTRAEMFKLRQTWNDVFPQMKLYAIDVQINLLDPAWPVTAKPPSNSIHFNPKFLKPPNTVISKPNIEPEHNKTLPPTPASMDKETLLMQEQLIQKQKELLELQQKKLELEVLQTKVKLQEQIKSNAPNVPITGRPQNILLKPEVAKQLVPTLKHNPPGIGTVTVNQQRPQNIGLRISPVNKALVAAASRPIRDPRLLRQQLKPANSNSNVLLGQKTTISENNKIVTNKTGFRKTRNDPRLINKDDVFNQKNDTNKPQNLGKSRNSDTVQKPPKTYRASSKSSTDSSSTKSSSTSSLDSPSKSKSDKVKSPVRFKKKDNSDEKRLSPKSHKRDKVVEIESHIAFKGVKSSTKNRNYVRRNLGTMSPELPQDVDLRSFGPPEKQPRLQGDPAEEKNIQEVPTTKGVDVDLRQLPAPVIGKKRPSTESSEQTITKKSKSEVFDKLFGDEDTDLRQLPTINADRPPTPPPPIISTTEPTPTEKVESPKNNLDAIRAKLANATNREKIMSKSFHKKKLLLEDQDLRVAKVSSSTDIPNKIIISPEDENCIKSGTLTKEQEAQLLQKIIMQMEVNKLQVAKRKDEESFNTSLQPISDDELVDSDEEVQEKIELKEDPVVDKYEPLSNPNPNTATPLNDVKHESSNDTSVIPFSNVTIEPLSDSSVIPFNDKDERLNMAHLQPASTQTAQLPLPSSQPAQLPLQSSQPHPPPQPPMPFHPRDGRDMRRYPPPNWRGGRGGRRFFENQTVGIPRAHIKPWNHSTPWRNIPPPNYIPSHEFVPMSLSVQEELTGSTDVSAFNQLGNGAVNLEEIKTINIDGVPKDIRYYGETAIAFVSWDEPREITFQDDGVRHIVFNGQDSYVLGFNEPYKDVLINGSPHRVRIGAPSREIFIDQVPYECYFGSAGIRINLEDVSTTVKLEGPPPPVKIGETKRTDLVGGKINLFINAKIVVPVFLDGKIQKFIIDGETNRLKFVNALLTVLINDIPFNVEYGGLPKPVVLHGKKHFIRFSVLPKGIRPGRIVIKDMEWLDNMSPKYDENSRDSMPSVDPYEPSLPIIDTVRQMRGTDSPDRNSHSPSFYQNILQQQNLNNLDVLSNAMTPSVGPVPTTDGYQVENSPSEDKPTDIPKLPVPAATPVVNINELFQKLVASGFVTSGNQKPSVPTSELTSEGKSDDSKTVSPPQGTPKIPIPLVPQVTPPKLRRNTVVNLRLITFAKPETLKTRQAALYNSLYAGMQCSSCGMRFSPEASMQYSQHLDWHFRQNRKGKKNIRVASSRRWYYSLSDWKNYEELEDLEEREKNYFDQQQAQEGTGDDLDEEIEIPSVPADPESSTECCEVCRDKFDQFFNEEKEEWHLRNATKIDDKTYHPVCYEDYQNSLVEQTLEDSKIDIDNKEGGKEETVIPGFEIIIDDDEDESEEPYDPADVVSLGSDDSKPVDENEESVPPPEIDEEDDDVILNEIAPIKIVVDDDEEDYIDENSSGAEDSVRIKKEKLDDGFVEVGGLVSLQNGGQIKIKAEPVDAEEVRPEVDIAPTTIETVELVEPEKPEEEFTHSHTELVTSIDGNTEIVSSAPSTVTTTGVSVNKIKINISKPVPVINSKEKESASESELPSETYIDPFEPFPPGEEPEPATLKPVLKGAKLTKLPPIRKGTELTGLCSIM